MAGAKETRNRSESQEQDEVRIHPAPHKTHLCDAEPWFTKQNFNTSDEEHGTGAAKPGRKKNPKYGQILLRVRQFYSLATLTTSRPRCHRHRAYVSLPPHFLFGIAL